MVDEDYRPNSSVSWAILLIITLGVCLGFVWLSGTAIWSILSSLEQTSAKSAYANLVMATLIGVFFLSMAGITIYGLELHYSTKITPRYITQLRPFPLRRVTILWKDVHEVEQVGLFLEFKSAEASVRIFPFLYKHPEELMGFIQKCVPDETMYISRTE